MEQARNELWNAVAKYHDAALKEVRDNPSPENEANYERIKELIRNFKF